MTTQWPELHIAREIATREGGAVREAVGLWGSAKTLAAVQAAALSKRPLLYITRGRIEAENAYEDMCTFAGEEKCLHFPAWEVQPTDMMDPADDIVAERMHALQQLAAGTGPQLVSLALRAAMQLVPNAKDLLGDVITLELGEEHDLEDLLARLDKAGYTREVMVERRGEVSVRGGIFDIFPISTELPYRLEFFGDEIESIRRFEPETQRSVDEVESVSILPRSEKDLIRRWTRNPEKLSTILDYVPANTLVVLDEPLDLQDEADKLRVELEENPFSLTWPALQERLTRYDQVRMAHISIPEGSARAHFAIPEGSARGQVPHAKGPKATRYSTSIHSVSGWAQDLDGFWKQLAAWERDTFSVRIVCGNSGARRRLLELLAEHGYSPDDKNLALDVPVGHVSSGFVSKEDKLAVLTERELFGRKHVRRTRRRFEAGEALTAFNDLKVGDYIVHDHHGIGRYLGLKRFTGKSGDFLTVSYTGGDKLYVPVTHIDTIQKYVGGDGAVPKIDRLGGATWARTRKRVKKAVREMTEELLKLYARRESQDGHAFSADTPWQTEFEEAFEYEETPDQIRAVADVKRDMEQLKPMDRLLCGDVGFGKTEVAVRAAFKAVQDGKQVAVLVPTTVLAQQHFATFSERMAGFPISIAELTRFSSAKEQREVVERLKSGEVDIVIGTHRLTSRDVDFKDLGLLILDEEQRFGVRHKEKLKQLKSTVDALVLSATPIPRTLNLSLMGIRDMSAINTAPNDRLPVHTCIETFDEELIQEAIRRELAREGQVFFLHNRVQTIDAVASFIERLVPEARVAVAHGQMGGHQLEEHMAAFIRRETDVLVCTTIIGSGLDIPNANTIIIDRADHFGLAELYQLRGRVGRYKHRAFAYLLVPGDRAITEEAQKRLKALEEFSTLGSGFRIAMRDLEIRGCGNVLGAEQSGQIAAVGLDMYTQLIEETVAELKGESVKRVTLPPFEIAVDAYIPEAYVPSEAQKITLYKRITSCASEAEVRDMAEELRDRFGAPPAPVKRLLEVMGLRALGAELGVKKIGGGKQAITLEFEHPDHLTDKTRNVLRQTLGGNVEFTWSDKYAVTYAYADANGHSAMEAAENLLRSLTEIMG